MLLRHDLSAAECVGSMIELKLFRVHVWTALQPNRIVNRGRRWDQPSLLCSGLAQPASLCLSALPHRHRHVLLSARPRPRCARRTTGHRARMVRERDSGADSAAATAAAEMRNAARMRQCAHRLYCTWHRIARVRALCVHACAVAALLCVLSLVSSLPDCSRPSQRSFSVAALNAQREGMLSANPNQDIPAPDGVERPNAKVQKIVDDIMQLNIFESIQLSKSLQVSSQRRRTSGRAERRQRRRWPISRRRFFVASCVGCARGAAWMRILSRALCE